MKFVIAIDSFKGSLSSIEAGRAAQRGVIKACPEAETVVKPVADGGEGTVASLAEGLGGKIECVTVTGPFGKKTTAEYLILNDGKSCVMEIASAAGITLAQKSELNPMKATSYGVGEMISDAMNKGCRNFTIGLGGSATNDGGCGMLSALGFAFTDSRGNCVPPGGKGLLDICGIKTENADMRLKECLFNVACDVNNPLCGADGASAVYGPQKGATPSMIHTLDDGLKNFSELTAKVFGNDVSSLPGTGAAGGLGFAFVAYLGGRLLPGTDLILDLIGIESDMKGADVLITGEGRVDAQTAMGKAPAGIASRGKKLGLTTVAVTGEASIDSETVLAAGIDAVFSIARGPMSLEEAMKRENAERNIEFTVEQIVGLIASVRKR